MQNYQNKMDQQQINRKVKLSQNKDLYTNLDEKNLSKLPAKKI